MPRSIIILLEVQQLTWFLFWILQYEKNDLESVFIFFATFLSKSRLAIYNWSGQNCVICGFCMAHLALNSRTSIAYRIPKSFIWSVRARDLIWLFSKILKCRPIAFFIIFINLTSGGSNFNDFPENQSTKFRAVYTVYIKANRDQIFCQCHPAMNEK